MLVNMTGGKKVTVVENVEPVLLWTNTNPTATFNPQTVSFDGSEYGGYIIEIKYYATTNYFQQFYMPNNGVKNQLCLTNDVSSIYANIAKRFVIPNSANVVFESGLNGSNVDQKYGVPTRIWGVKFTL